jgi:hypothetical protein
MVRWRNKLIPCEKQSHKNENKPLVFNGFERLSLKKIDKNKLIISIIKSEPCERL